MSVMRQPNYAKIQALQREYNTVYNQTAQLQSSVGYHTQMLMDLQEKLKVFPMDASLHQRLNSEVRQLNTLKNQIMRNNNRLYSISAKLNAMSMPR